MTFERTTSIFAASVLALAAVAPGLASADVPSRLVGTIADFHGKYGVVVRDAAGQVVDVQLHQGTIIKPTGLRLERGMQVTILGQATDGAFAVAEIDTPYRLPTRTWDPFADSGPSTRGPSPADNARFGDFPGNPRPQADTRIP